MAHQAEAAPSCKSHLRLKGDCSWLQCSIMHQEKTCAEMQYNLCSRRGPPQELTC